MRNSLWQLRRCHSSCVRNRTRGTSCCTHDVLQNVLPRAGSGRNGEIWSALRPARVVSRRRLLGDTHSSTYSIVRYSCAWPSQWCKWLAKMGVSGLRYKEFAQVWDIIFIFVHFVNQQVQFREILVKLFFSRFIVAIPGYQFLFRFVIVEPAFCYY